MARKFLDANVILRHLTQDHPEHSAAVLPLFEQIEAGTLDVTTSESVIVEVVQVLSSKTLYNLPRSQVRQKIEPLLGLRGMKLPARSVYARALALYEGRSVDFTDALRVAQMEHQQLRVILSFARDFDRFDTVEREEPATP
jgi:predicted nucleic acid-binding protein